MAKNVREIECKFFKGSQELVQNIGTGFEKPRVPKIAVSDQTKSKGNDFWFEE